MVVASSTTMISCCNNKSSLVLERFMDWLDRNWNEFIAKIGAKTYFDDLESILQELNYQGNQKLVFRMLTSVQQQGRRGSRKDDEEKARRGPPTSTHYITPKDCYIFRRLYKHRKRVGARTPAALKEHLRQKYGSMSRVWLRILTPTKFGTVDYNQFTKLLSFCSYEGTIKECWSAFHPTRDHHNIINHKEGIISLKNLDFHEYRLLTKFFIELFSRYDDMDVIWYRILSKNRKNSISKEEFIDRLSSSQNHFVVNDVQRHNETPSGTMDLIQLSDEIDYDVIGDDDECLHFTPLEAEILFHLIDLDERGDIILNDMEEISSYWCFGSLYDISAPALALRVKRKERGIQQMLKRVERQKSMIEVAHDDDATSSTHDDSTTLLAVVAKANENEEEVHKEDGKYEKDGKGEGKNGSKMHPFQTLVVGNRKRSSIEWEKAKVEVLKALKTESHINKQVPSILIPHTIKPFMQQTGASEQSMKAIRCLSLASRSLASDREEIARKVDALGIGTLGGALINRKTLHDEILNITTGLDGDNTIGMRNKLKISDPVNEKMDSVQSSRNLDKKSGSTTSSIKGAVLDFKNRVESDNDTVKELILQLLREQKSELEYDELQRAEVEQQKQHIIGKLGKGRDSELNSELRDAMEEFLKSSFLNAQNTRISELENFHDEVIFHLTKQTDVGKIRPNLAADPITRVSWLKEEEKSVHHQLFHQWLKRSGRYETLRVRLFENGNRNFVTKRMFCCVLRSLSYPGDEIALFYSLLNFRQYSRQHFVKFSESGKRSTNQRGSIQFPIGGDSQGGSADGHEETPFGAVDGAATPVDNASSQAASEGGTLKKTKYKGGTRVLGERVSGWRKGVDAKNSTYWQDWWEDSEDSEDDYEEKPWQRISEDLKKSEKQKADMQYKKITRKYELEEVYTEKKDRLQKEQENQPLGEKEKGSDSIGDQDIDLHEGKHEADGYSISHNTENESNVMHSNESNAMHFYGEPGEISQVSGMHFYGESGEISPMKSRWDDLSSDPRMDPSSDMKWESSITYSRSGEQSRNALLHGHCKSDLNKSDLNESRNLELVKTHQELRTSPIIEDSVRRIGESDRVEEATVHDENNYSSHHGRYSDKIGHFTEETSGDSFSGDSSFAFYPRDRMNRVQDADAQLNAVSFDKNMDRGIESISSNLRGKSSSSKQKSHRSEMGISSDNMTSSNLGSSISVNLNGDNITWKDLIEGVVKLKCTDSSEMENSTSQSQEVHRERTQSRENSHSSTKTSTLNPCEHYKGSIRNEMQSGKGVDLQNLQKYESGRKFCDLPRAHISSKIKNFVGSTKWSVEKGERPEEHVADINRSANWKDRLIAKYSDNEYHASDPPPTREQVVQKLQKKRKEKIEGNFVQHQRLLLEDEMRTMTKEDEIRMLEHMLESRTMSQGSGPFLFLGDEEGANPDVDGRVPAAGDLSVECNAPAAGDSAVERNMDGVVPSAAGDQTPPVGDEPSADLHNQNDSGNNSAEGQHPDDGRQDPRYSVMIFEEEDMNLIATKGSKDMNLIANKRSSNSKTGNLKLKKVRGGGPKKPVNSENPDAPIIMSFDLNNPAIPPTGSQGIGSTIAALSNLTLFPNENEVLEGRDTRSGLPLRLVKETFLNPQILHFRDFLAFPIGPADMRPTVHSRTSVEKEMIRLVGRPLVRGWTRYLDPSNSGIIDFREFCVGMAKLKVKGNFRNLWALYHPIENMIDLQHVDSDSWHLLASFATAVFNLFKSTSAMLHAVFKVSEETGVVTFVQFYNFCLSPLLEFTKKSSTVKKLWACFTAPYQDRCVAKELHILEHFECRVGAIFRIDLFPVYSDWLGPQYYCRPSPLSPGYCQKLFWLGKRLTEYPRDLLDESIRNGGLHVNLSSRRGYGKGKDQNCAMQKDYRKGKTAPKELKDELRLGYQIFDGTKDTFTSVAGQQRNANNNQLDHAMNQDTSTSVGGQQSSDRYIRATYDINRGLHDTQTGEPFPYQQTDDQPDENKTLRIVLSKQEHDALEQERNLRNIVNGVHEKLSPSHQVHNPDKGSGKKQSSSSKSPKPRRPGPSGDESYHRQLGKGDMRTSKVPSASASDEREFEKSEERDFKNSAKGLLKSLKNTRREIPFEDFIYSRVIKGEREDVYGVDTDLLIKPKRTNKDDDESEVEDAHHRVMKMITRNEDDDSESSTDNDDETNNLLERSVKNLYGDFKRQKREHRREHNRDNKTKKGDLTRSSTVEVYKELISRPKAYLPHYDLKNKNSKAQDSSHNPDNPRCLLGLLHNLRTEKWNTSSHSNENYAVRLLDLSKFLSNITSADLVAESGMSMIGHSQKKIEAKVQEGKMILRHGARITEETDSKNSKDVLTVGDLLQEELLRGLVEKRLTISKFQSDIHPSWSPEELMHLLYIDRDILFVAMAEAADHHAIITDHAIRMAGVVVRPAEEGHTDYIFTSESRRKLKRLFGEQFAIRGQTVIDFSVSCHRHRHPVDQSIGLSKRGSNASLGSNPPMRSSQTTSGIKDDSDSGDLGDLLESD